MKTRRGHWQGVGLALLLVLVVVPSVATAATTVRTVTASKYLVGHPTLLAAPPVTIGANAVVHFAAAPGYAAAGTQGTTQGLQGTTVVLAACAGACTDNYRPASAAAIVAGDYTDRVTFTVTQPGRAGTSVGFDVEVAVDLTTGWVFGKGYFATGLATTVGAATITLHLFVVLGTAVPTVHVVRVTVDRCTATTGCP